MAFGATANFREGSPVIGMFSLPTDPQFCESSHCEALPASYVKFIESAGGEVVPVSFYATESEMDLLLESLNGFLFTGGADMDPPAAALRVLERSRQLFEAGDPQNQLPVWGTCLGFEWLVAATSPSSLLSGFRASNVNLPLHLTPEASSSRLFEKATQRIMNALLFENVTFNSHHRGVPPAEWMKPELWKTLKVLATSFDEDGKEFVSVVEGVNGLPWFGVQFHPEKNAFEHGFLPSGQPAVLALHTPNAIAVTQFLSNFFVQQARKNIRSFRTVADEAKRLIYGHQTSRAFQPYFDEVFLFSTASKSSNETSVTPQILV